MKGFNDYSLKINHFVVWLMERAMKKFSRNVGIEKKKIKFSFVFLFSFKNTSTNSSLNLNIISSHIFSHSFARLSHKLLVHKLWKSCKLCLVDCRLLLFPFLVKNYCAITMVHLQRLTHSVKHFQVHSLKNPYVEYYNLQIYFKKFYDLQCIEFKPKIFQSMQPINIIYYSFSMVFIWAQSLDTICISIIPQFMHKFFEALQRLPTRMRSCWPFTSQYCINFNEVLYGAKSKVWRRVSNRRLTPRFAGQLRFIHEHLIITHKQSLRDPL